MILSAQEVTEKFKAEGKSIAAWARDHGFKPVLVYQVLRARNVPVRGKCHEIAVALKLKEPRGTPDSDFITRKA